MKKHAAALALAMMMFMSMGFVGDVRGVVRLHVIANSDDGEDQRVKLLVRDEVLQTLSTLQNAHSGEEARETVLQNGALLQSRVEALLRREGADYGARLYMGQYPFPEKNYGDVTYPAGEYMALRVVLGEGTGLNWWCVLFPPLCLSESPASTATPRSAAQGKGKPPVRFRSAIATWLQGQ